MNLAKVTITGTDAPVSQGKMKRESYINADQIVAVEPEKEDESIIRLNVEGAYRKIDVEGDVKAIKKKLD